MKFLAVIPARYGSGRFPGKPLELLKGKPILQWVVEGAKKSTLISEVIVATDDQRIADLCQKIGVNFKMTPTTCETGTDRIFVATQDLNFDFVLNIQGDEPLIGPEFIDPMIEAFKKEPQLDMTTLAHPIEASDIENLNAVKVITDQYSNAIYFSRFPIPHSRVSAGENSAVCLKHIGLYGFSKGFLQKFCTTKPTEIEKCESLEQLRALYLGAKIKVLKVTKATYGVDTPEDLQKLERLIK